MATQIWDSSYENIPADNDQASEGALRIRNLKRDIRERAEIDHDWDDVTDSGKHTQITFVDPLGADPGDVTDEGMLYTKNVSAKAELFWKDEDGNVLQLTAAGVIPFAALAGGAALAAGTKALFQQTAAPTGWTKDTTHDDKALRVVTGTPSSGGTNAFSVALNAAFASASYTLLEADIPGHVHTNSTHNHTFVAAGRDTGAGTAFNLLIDAGAAALNSGFVDAGDAATVTVSTAGGASTGSFGGDGGHGHNVDLDVQYVDLIIATKD